jgi:hypothetical protein
MKSFVQLLFIIIILNGSGILSVSYGQDLSLKIGDRVILNSEILNEQRSIIIHLPANYSTTKKTYPILYRLDGNMETMLESVAITKRLSETEEIIPEMIIVGIENINRPRDMWPVKTKYYDKNPGAEDFLNFISLELLPYIEKNYRTSDHKILCGQSLSGVFTLYTLLSKPNLFSSYIISSGAFPDCGDYFNNLSKKAFLQIDQLFDKDIFITNGLKDPLDLNGKSHKQILDFSNTLKEKLATKSKIKYVTYENEGHVPFFSLYDGLKFIFIQK